jgi:hypothetical protein
MRGWRGLSPSAELFVDPDSGARCVIRDTGAARMQRYLWTVMVFGDYQLAEGRTGKLVEARLQAEAALAAYTTAWHESPGHDAGNAGRPSPG